MLYGPEEPVHVWREEVMPSHEDLVALSNAAWSSTGYGQQTALFVPRLRDLGHDIAISAFYGLHGQATGWKPTPDDPNPPIMVFPGGNDAYGNDVISAHYRAWAGDGVTSRGLVVLLTDPWVMKSQVMSRLPVLAWVPVDHDPAPPATTNWFQATGALPLAMSRFGQELLAGAGLETLYCPHGVDTSVFFPDDLRAARERIGIQLDEDTFLVSIVAANQGRPGRKGWGEMLQAYQQFARRHDDVAVYLHTQVVNPGGEPLLDLIRDLQLKPHCVDQYRYVSGLPANHVADVMRASNVLLNTAHGEGFGITMLEAQACGVPVIATNFSAMAEVVGKGCGWLVDGQRNWTRFDSWQVTPSIPKIVKALEAAHEEWRAGESRSDACVAHASAYEVGHVTETYWRPVLEEAAEMLRWRATQPNVVRL